MICLRQLLNFFQVFNCYGRKESIPLRFRWYKIGRPVGCKNIGYPVEPVVRNFFNLINNCFRKIAFILVIIKGFNKIMKRINLIEVIVKIERRINQKKGIEAVTCHKVIIEQNILAYHANSLITGKRVYRVVKFVIIKQLTSNAIAHNKFPCIVFLFAFFERMVNFVSLNNGFIFPADEQI